MIYRREIDGLRAVAVVPVILFHAGLKLFSGGYVGVDIFFVISGYLITSILIDETERGDFSISRFYERRARRILPALFLVMLCCIPFAWMWMTPAELKDFSQSLAAVTLFCSNVLFWIEEGYFSPISGLKPLLHTWSLAVEEQYYLIFPLFLTAAWKLGRKRVLWAVVAVAAISLIASEWGWRHGAEANFYLAPTRTWELLTGSICAFCLSARGGGSNNWLSLAGLSMIGLSIFAYDELTPFPSVYTLVPVVGTALIIVFDGPNTWVARLLGMKAFVGIGLLSYSAYLWHQPLFAFMRIRSMVEPAQSLMIALALLSLILAYCSWRYVETPFRNRSKPILPTQRALFIASAVVGGAILALGVAGSVGGGFKSRFPKNIQRYDLAERDVATLDCHVKSGSRWEPPTNRCDKAVESRIDTMFIGDSHLWALTDGLRAELDRRSQSYYIASQTSCLPLSGLRTFDGPKEYDCQDFIDKSFGWAKAHHVHTVVIAARFPLYLYGERYNNMEGGVEFGNCGFVDLNTNPRTSCHDGARAQRVLKLFEARIGELSRSFNIVLVHPIPEAGWVVPSQAFKRAYFDGDRDPLTTSYYQYRVRNGEITNLFDRLEKVSSNIYTARVENHLCNKISERCINTDRNGVYYSDDDHLTNAGARLVAPVIVDAVERANAHAHAR